MENTISFDNLRNYNDSNSFVWVALLFNPAQQQEIEDWLKEQKFMPADAKIVRMAKISGNVREALGDSRTDVFFETTDTTFNPLARLRIQDIKWTSDFIPNYSKDYGQNSEFEKRYGVEDQEPD